MGYYATGNGTAVFKKGVDTEKIEAILNNLKDNDIEFDISDTDICFWENNYHWHAKDTMEFLEALAPYIKEGCANYSGEEDCIWRYKFDPEKESWEEDFATIDYSFESYSDDELIAELTKRGYTITKIMKEA